MSSMAAVKPENEHPVKAFGWAARDESGILSPFHFSRRKTGKREVRFKVMYCAICYSDREALVGRWGYPTNYPVVPGHELTGIVIEVGVEVQKFKPGDKVGVGGFIGSCRSCENCLNDLENYCLNVVPVFNSTYYDGTKTYGGFSDSMVVDENYLIHFPNNFPLDGGAPLLCAGITVYSAMKYYGLATAGLNIGVVGLGGLGHLVVKFAKAFGVRVTVISTSRSKKKDALEHLNADSFLFSGDPDQIEAAKGTMDGIIDTAPARHPILPLLHMLKPHKNLVAVGEPESPLEVPIFPLIMGRRKVVGSTTGGIKETQEMIDFCAKHHVTADIEVIPMEYVNKAIERLVEDDVKYRFVIDVGKSLHGIAL